MKLLVKDKLDVSKVFLAYVSLQGDAERTAMACDLEPEQVRLLAEQEQWATKTRQFAALREQDADFQISLNRTLAYIQARQLSGLVDGVIKHLSENLVEALTVCTTTGSHFNTKPLTDLVKAAEMLQMMQARALGDQGGQVGAEKIGGASIGLSVARALNAVAANQGVDSVTIVKNSLAGHDTQKLPGASPG